ncbi:hypothetical protein KVR01_008917 [Diaporthe batatas]|uniref:uncharacterized protein n=1 Tax=Diaporthe batatas TaxID=748121 RepID=UPI001D05469B|nr:uncharacterized protein KVR01_008917 [Diaporthe batatas]KAG8160653.1 hypothetical protein KVR01_008917 [Diaporthe batatas]
MANKQAIERCLDALLSSGPEYLAELNSDRVAFAHGTNGSHRQHVQKSHDSRKKLIDAATRLIQLLTGPEEYLDHLANSYQELTCVRWLLDLDVLKHLPLDGSSIDYSHLASKANVPEGHLKSVSRMAVVNGFLEESKSSSPGISHTLASAQLVQDESFVAWARWMLDYSMPVAYKFADATRTWPKAESKNEVAFNLAMDTTDNFFDYLKKTPDMTALFSGYMRSVTASRPWSLHHAVQSFDWGSLPKGAKVVDIGGSHGQLCVEVAKEFKNLEFIVQDLPEAVETARQSFNTDTNIDPGMKSRIKFMSHDFFQPQPVVDAHVYFLRMIIHDWPDKEALVILKHLRRVLEQNPVAKIVLMDTVLPRPGTTTCRHEQRLRVRDLMMRQVFNSREREMEEWTALLDQAGLGLSNVTMPDDSVMGVLTAHLKDIEPSARMRHQSQIKPQATEDLNDQPVLIVGAGISGLCLAQALNKARIPFRVFERDAALDSRPQGYRLKLQADASKALAEILPEDIYQEFQTSCAILSVGETNFSPFSGNITHSRSGGGLSGSLGLSPTYTVDRATFRRTLTKGISDRVTFNKDLDKFTVDEHSNRVSVKFKDGEVVHGRFIVGADGLHSAVRRQYLPSHSFKDTGAICVYGKTQMTPDLLKSFPEKGLRWMTVVSDSAPMLQSCIIGETPVTLLLEPIRFSQSSRQAHGQRLPEDYVYWALIGPEKRFPLGGQGQNGLGGVHASPKSTLIQRQGATGHSCQASSLALQVTTEWHPSLRSVLELQDTSQATLIRVASQVAEVPVWEPSAWVTLLGDAIHPMSPCGGVGANTAICDAASLAKVLVAWNGSPVENSVGAFESDMRRRAHVSIVRSEIGSKKMFGLKSLAECQIWTGL